MKTKVVDVRFEEYDYYIGRYNKNIPKDKVFNNYELKNPFKMHKEKDREKVIKQFEIYFMDMINKSEKFRTSLKELKGKTLGCWCNKKNCHGHIIAEFVDKEF